MLCLSDTDKNLQIS